MFTLQTTYNQKALTVMAHALRKTLRKRHSILTRIFISALIAVFILFVASYFLIGEAGENIFTLTCYIVTIVLLTLIILMEDNLNGWIAGKQMIPNAKEGMNIPVYHEKLSQALTYLMPKDREIILLYFFKGLKDAKVAPLVHMSRPTVSRRRKAAMNRLRELMEDST